MPPETIDAPPYADMGLSAHEYSTLKSQLNREPTSTELGMFAVLWSEHCSYKSSKKVLKLFSNYKLSAEGKGLENAGVVDIGDNIGIAFKVESHNHPSAVEPYEGAATGVGGIIRDILTMGARPIASLNSLRFGDISKNAEDKRLFDGVVQGIGGYGNCVGVPTVAGEVFFHERYSGNPLVNAMCIGRLDLDKIATATAQGVGNPVLYLGSATGCDGIHGATFASEVLDEDSDSKRPNVQIGDPFAGKLLIEATLEALKTGAIVGIQDMGAAGLTCSTCEMSAKGGVGMDIDLNLVPVRDRTMSAYEIMLSESQERMLAVTENGRENEVLDIFKKWGLPAAVIGVVTGDGQVRIKHHGKVEAVVPAELITEGCPMLDLKGEKPENVDKAARFSTNRIPPPAAFGGALSKLLSSPSIASKRWVFEQYDHTVQTQTALKPGLGDAAVIALRGTKKGIATKIDGNSRWTYADPFSGGQLAVAEAARNVACTGARPAAATDCLNFGDPNLPHVYWQFQESVRGIANACEALRIPVLSGNVSFYNETEVGDVLPTPTIGVVGVLDNAENALRSHFPHGHGFIYLLYGNDIHAPQDGLGTSEYVRVIHGLDEGAPQKPNLFTEMGLIEVMVNAAADKLVDCAHDTSEGGLAVALAEMCFEKAVGCNVIIDAQEHYQKHILEPILNDNSSLSQAVIHSLLDAERQLDPWTFSRRMDARLFGEMPGRILVGIGMDKLMDGAAGKLATLAAKHGLNMHCLGTFDRSMPNLTISTPSSQVMSASVEALRTDYEEALPALMSR
ncbi:MAG: phosphoribosylformylglycinamidine synthase subunit PurL [Fimbriimonadales bacterium]